MESRTQKSARNYFYSIVSQVLLQVIKFITVTAFLKTFGADYLGIDNLFVNLLTVISLADLGLASAMAYSYYGPLAEGNEEKLAALTTYFQKVYRGIILLIGIIGLLVMLLLPYIVKLDTEIPHLRVYYILALLNTMLSYICAYKATVLTADQNGYMLTRIDIVANILMAIVRLFVILVFKSYFLFLLTAVIRTILGNVAYSIVSDRQYSFISEKKALSETERKEVIGAVIPSFVNKFCDVMGNTTDYLLTSVMIGTLTVGYYANYSTIQKIATLPYTLLTSAITSSVGNLISSEDGDMRYEVYQQVRICGFISCAVIIPCYSSLVGSFIKLWAGDEYVLTMSVLAAICINMFTLYYEQTLLPFHDAMGLFRYTKKIKLIQAFLNLGLSILLGHLIGFGGIILASALSRLMTSGWYVPKIVFAKCFSRSPAKYLRDYIFSGAYTCLLSLVCIFIVYLFNIKTWMGWICEAIGILSFCIILTLPIASRMKGSEGLVSKFHIIFSKRV